MAKEKVKLQFVIRVNGDAWVIKVYTKSHFIRQWPDADAITVYDHTVKYRVINFCGPKASRDTIAHELFHAYCSYHDFSKMSYGKIEEKICEILGKKHKTLYNLTNRIYSSIRSRSSKINK